MPTQFERTSPLLLLAIGKGVQAEYTAVKEPLPERLAALLKKLESPPPPGGARQSISPRRRTMPRVSTRS